MPDVESDDVADDRLVGDEVLARGGPRRLAEATLELVVARARLAQIDDPAFDSRNAVHRDTGLLLHLARGDDRRSVVDEEPAYPCVFEEPGHITVRIGRVGGMPCCAQLGALGLDGEPTREPSLHRDREGRRVGQTLEILLGRARQQAAVGRGGQARARQRDRIEEPPWRIGELRLNPPSVAVSIDDRHIPQINPSRHA